MAEKLSPEESHSGIRAWQPGVREPLVDCRVFQVERVWFRHPGKERESDFFVIRSPDWVHVVAHTTDDRIILVRQYRFGSEEFSLEAPGGLIEPGEDPIAAARRELLEETGYGSGTARVLSQLRPNPALQKNTCHLVLLEGVVPTAALTWDEHEELETSVLAADEAIALVHNGGITHSLSMLALLLFASGRNQGAAGPAV